MMRFIAQHMLRYPHNSFLISPRKHVVGTTEVLLINTTTYYVQCSKRALMQFTDNAGLDLGLRCPLTESMDTLVQSNLDSSNTDGSFTMANSNSFLSPYEILPIA